MPVSLKALTPKQKQLYDKIKQPYWDEPSNAVFHSNVVSTLAQMPPNLDGDVIAEVLKAECEPKLFNVDFLWICFGNIPQIKKEVTAEVLANNKRVVLGMAAIGECFETIFEILPVLLDYDQAGTFVSLAAKYSSYEYLLKLLEKYPHMVAYSLHNSSHPAYIFAENKPDKFFRFLTRYPEILAADDVKQQWKYLDLIIYGNNVKALFDFLEKYPRVFEVKPQTYHDELAYRVANSLPHALIPLLQKYPVLKESDGYSNRSILEGLYKANADQVLFDLLCIYPDLIAYNPKTGPWSKISSGSYRQVSIPLLLVRVASAFEKMLQPDAITQANPQQEHAIRGLKILVDNKIDAAQMILTKHHIPYVSEVHQIEENRQQKIREEQLKQQQYWQQESARRQQAQAASQLAAQRLLVNNGNAVQNQPAAQLLPVAQMSSAIIDQQNLLSENAQLKETNKNQAQALEAMSLLNLKLYEEIAALKKRSVSDEADVDSDASHHLDKRTRKATLGGSGAFSSYQMSKPLFFNAGETPGAQDANTASTTMNPVAENVPQ